MGNQFFPSYVSIIIGYLCQIEVPYKHIRDRKTLYEVTYEDTILNQCKSHVHHLKYYVKNNELLHCTADIMQKK